MKVYLDARNTIEVRKGRVMDEMVDNSQFKSRALSMNFATNKYFCGIFALL